MKQLRGVVASVGASSNFPGRCFLDRLTRLKRRPRQMLAVLAVLAACCGSARANLTIVATYDPSIATNSNSGSIETAINSAITLLDGYILNNVTVSIDFGLENDPDLLGSSLTGRSNVTYTSYLNALNNNQTVSPNDTIAIASLPAGPNNPVNGNASIITTTPLLRALGYTAPAGIASTDGGLAATNGFFDSVITFSLDGVNLSRPGVSTNYDLQSTAEHEIDEVLGIGGTGSAIRTNSGALTGAVGPLDLYRYSAAGVRSFTASTNAVSFFSINGGTNKLVNFNQGFGGGSDYGDWGDGTNPADGFGNGIPLVQDAFGTTGTAVDVGINELTGLDVVGWNLVPEPSTVALVVVGVLGTAWSMRRRRKG